MCVLEVSSATRMDFPGSPPYQRFQIQWAGYFFTLNPWRPCRKRGILGKEKKSLNRIWLPDKQANGGERLFGAVRCEFSVELSLQPWGLSSQFLWAMYFFPDKTSACFKTEVVMRFCSGRNVESCAEEHSPCCCQAAWAGMNNGCYKSLLCLLQQPQKVRSRMFHEASQLMESDLPGISLVLESLGTHTPFFSPLGLFPNDHFRDFWQEGRSRSQCLQQISLCLQMSSSGEIFYDMAEQTLVLWVIHGT